MRWTRTLVPTLREAPSDAESPSHRLMIRAGLVRPLAAGSYTYLPLGLRALRKVEHLVRQEMDRAGALEVLLPSLQPMELWRESGRLERFGPALMQVKDRRGGVSVLGPAHEEVATHLMRIEGKSYRQLPITLYQIQGKFRDEVHPRDGLLCTREFLTKDAYSFDVDAKGMDRSYQAMFDAYQRVFSRAGLKVVAVEAGRGDRDGEVSHDFMAGSPHGLEEVLACSGCPYRATREGAECPPFRNGSTGADTRQILPIQEIPTPGAHTVDQVSAYLHVAPRQLIKTLIYRTDAGFLAALVRGDHEVNEAKLRRAAKAERLELASPEEIERQTGGPLGFSGPVGLRLRMIADHGAVEVSNGVTGANKPDAHYSNVNVNRDFRPDTVMDIRLAVIGDPCPRCRAPLGFLPAIEVGAMAKLGTRYSHRMNCRVPDDQGQLHPVAMGRYGIGLGRILAAAIEQHHEEAGILWPKELAPFQVHLISLDHKKMQIVETAQDLYESLSRAGLEVLWDDREVAAGVKFADADLIGLPVRAVVGKRTLEAGTVDVRTRAAPAQKSVLLDKVLETVQHELSAYPY